MIIPAELITHLRQAERVAVLTGAGISAESGVPTFRDAQTGLWARYDPQELATPQAFHRNPQLVWDWYRWRRELTSQAIPNAGHLALAEMARRVPHFTLITQNVDGLHQRAGSQAVIELHGSLARSRCAVEDVLIEGWPAGPGLPTCPRCGSLLRPDVVWFGEALPAGALKAAINAARAANLFFTIGTSALVYPAAELPLEALERGATVVEINPERTPLTHYLDFVLTGPAGEILPLLLHETWPDDQQ